MGRVHQQIVLPGRVYVPPMDLRNLGPAEAHALREHVLELRRQNLDAELRGDFDQNGTRGQEWYWRLLEHLLSLGAAFTVRFTTFSYNVLHGAVTSGRFAYRRRDEISRTLTVVVVSTCNAVKRRIVSVTAPIPNALRIRPNLRPPSPRRRNGVIRQPPMTSNLARWEDDMRARREESLMLMQGVEPGPAGVSDYMMSGAIMDLAEDECINHHYNPFYTPLPIDTTALDACVREKAHADASPTLFAIDRDNGEDVGSFMRSSEDLTARQHPENLRQIFVGFSPPHLVENDDPELKNQLASATGPSSTKLATLNEPAAIASSSTELITYRPADAFTPIFANTDSSTSLKVMATGATESDAYNLTEPPVESMMPEPRNPSIGLTNYERFLSTIVDDTYSDLSDDSEHQLPLCDFQGGAEPSIVTEINRATNKNMELDLHSNISSDEEIGGPGARAEKTVPIEPTTISEAGLGSNANSPRENTESQLSHSAGNSSMELTKEKTPVCSSTHQIQNESLELQVSHVSHPVQNESQGLQVSHVSQSVQNEVHEEEIDVPLEASQFESEIDQAFLIPAPTPVQIEDQESSSIPGSFNEDEDEQQLFSRLSRAETTEQNISYLEFTPTHGFEQENFPLSSEQLDSTIPISSVQILQEKSSGQTTPTQSYEQQRPFLAASFAGLPDEQNFPLSPGLPGISLPVTPSPDRKQWSPTSNMKSPNRVAKKSVMFFRSPKTGRPVTKTRTYILGESMDFPVSSSPAPNRGASTESGFVAFDSPTTNTENDRSFSYDPSTPTSLHYLTEEAAAKEKSKFETGSHMGETPEPAGDLTSRTRNDEEIILELTRSSAGSLEADKPALETQFTETTVDGSSQEANQPTMGERSPAGSVRDEAIATPSRKPSSESLHDALEFAKREPSRRKSSSKRPSAQPARKSRRLQNKSPKISPPRITKVAEELTILDLSGRYDTTANTSKDHQRTVKAEQARVKQAAIEAAEKAHRAKVEAEEKARKEAEEVKEKARVAKEEAEKKAQREQEEEEERQRKPTRRIPQGKIIQPLTAEWEARVQAAMDTPDMNSVLVTLPSGTKLNRRVFGTLKVVPGRDPSHGWLNDEIIAASIQQVVDYGLRISNHVAGKTPKYHAFNTFFYKNLRNKGAASIKRWATKAKIGGRALEEVERVFIPINQDKHWTLLVVSPVARTIEYFDSMGGPAEEFIRNAKLWLAMEMGARFHEGEWAVPTGTHGVGPRQTNGSDCGVFTCMNARMVALGIDPMAYGGEDMCVQRGRMVAELLNGGLFGDFDPNF